MIDVTADTASPPVEKAPARPPRARTDTTAVDRWVWVAVIVAIAPLLWRAVIYAGLGSLTPLVAFLMLGGLLVSAAAVGGSWPRRAIRVWCAAMILWGTARIVLQVMVVAVGLNEAHLQSQMTVGFGVVSAAYGAAGIMIWKRT